MVRLNFNNIFSFGFYYRLNAKKSNQMILGNNYNILVIGWNFT